MAKLRTLQILLLTLAFGVIGPIVVTAMLVWWRMPVDTWLPGALSLFFIPYFGSAVGGGWLLVRPWRVSGPVEKGLAFLLLLVGPYLGILLSIPFVCSIAKECL